MHLITPFAAALIAVAAVAAPQSPKTMPAEESNAATTYEHLATAIIAIRETEDSLVRGMLTDYFQAASMHLYNAMDAGGSARTRQLEAAATQITNLANEGDKRIQAVRQRLLKAGHHHHTDAETEEDYIFIDSGEKKALLTLAGSVARMGRAPGDDLQKTARELGTLFDSAMRPE